MLKLVLMAGVLFGILLLAGAGCRQVLQHRAIYPGGLIFVGAADGLFESRYHRVFLWKAPGYADPLPAVTVDLGESAYSLESLTPELFAGLGGAANEGALYDSAGALVQYRFENGRLTWFSLDSGRATPMATGGNVQAGTFALSRNGGPAVTLPVSGRALENGLGTPDDIQWVFAQ